MQRKACTVTEDMPMTICEPAVDYGTMVAEPQSSTKWNPNVPFHCTQEEFLEHIHSIEQGDFYPVAEVHQRISKWMYNQKR